MSTSPFNLLHFLLMLQFVELELCNCQLLHCNVSGGQALQVAEVVSGLVLHQVQVVWMVQGLPHVPCKAWLLVPDGRCQVLA